LTATNTACSGALGSFSLNITSGSGGGGGLAAAFTFSPAAPSTGQAVSFDPSPSTGNPTIFGWTFGDGSSSSVHSPSHVYTSAGNYSVVLTVCAGVNCVSSAAKTIIVGDGGQLPLDSSFTSSASCFSQPGFSECDAQAGVVVTLTAVTTQATSYAWDFGDGTTGSGASVTHTWSTAGSFNVKLTVANSQTSASQTRLFKITPAADVAKSVLLPWIAVTRGVLVQSSDLYVHNPGTTPMDVSLEFRRRGTPEDNPPRATRTVAPGATLFSADVLGDLFGRPENTVGFVTVSVPSGMAPVITSYNTTFQTNGTQFGQTISGVSMTPAAAPSSASPHDAAVQQLVALNDNSDEVSYFGLSNPNDQPATYRLSLFDSSGSAIGTPTNFVVARLGLKQFQREEIESLFNVANTHDYRVQIESVSGGQIYPYGAKLRTISFDPSFIRPGTARSRVYVIGALSTPGLNGTLWRSDMVLSNPSAQAIQTTVSFASVGVASQTLAPITVTLQPGETQRLANVVADKWGVTDAVGILTFDTDPASPAFPVVQGESYDFSTSVRRFGQSMPALADTDAAVAGQGHYMVGLRQDASHWTAFWLFNPSTDFGTYDLVYRGLDGSVLGQITGFHLPPGKSKLFRPSEHPIPAAGVDGGFTVQILVHNGKALAAGQVVNLSTNDPAYIVGTTR
ncbi:MAG TPA: PKD domain-containing protein, partial [Thermoanaerobaculia bacterium]